MPSKALGIWRADRIQRLCHLEEMCDVEVDDPDLVPTKEFLQAGVMLLSGHFQGFCRDLYTECSVICAESVPQQLKVTVQIQFTASLALNTGNPTVENIRKDFTRFGSVLDLKADPENASRVTDLGHLNFWRNACAHQSSNDPPDGIPAHLSVATLRKWRESCDGLALSLDDTMTGKLEQIIGKKPW